MQFSSSVQRDILERKQAGFSCKFRVHWSRTVRRSLFSRSGFDNGESGVNSLWRGDCGLLTIPQYHSNVSNTDIGSSCSPIRLCLHNRERTKLRSHRHVIRNVQNRKAHGSLPMPLRQIPNWRQRLAERSYSWLNTSLGMDKELFTLHSSSDYTSLTIATDILKQV